MKILPLIIKLQEIYHEHGEDVDAETFSGKLGLYDKHGEEIKEINLEKEI